MGWLTGWQYRKNCTVAGAAGAGTNFQISLTAYYTKGTDSGSSVYLEGLCNTDFTDVRFTSKDGSTLLSYWLQTKTDSVSATYWLKIADTLESADTNIYVYYGKATAASLSNQADTFVDVISGVVGAWNMEEAAGNCTDYSGNSNTGVPTGTTVVAGKFTGKNARNFAGGNNVVNCGNNASLITNQEAITLWIKADAGYGDIAPRLTEHNDYVRHYFLITVATGKPEFFYKDNLAAQGGVPNSVIPVNSWVHLTYQHNGSAVLFHNDNTKFTVDATTGNTLASSGASNFLIGNNAAANRGLKASVCNVTKFNTGLSDAQIANLVGNYPDVTLEAGKVLVRKYATSTQPSISSWMSPAEAVQETAGEYLTRKREEVKGAPAPTPDMPVEFIRLVKAWLEAKTRRVSLHPPL